MNRYFDNKRIAGYDQIGSRAFVLAGVGCDIQGAVFQGDT